MCDVICFREERFNKFVYLIVSKWFISVVKFGFFLIFFVVGFIGLGCIVFGLGFMFDDVLVFIMLFNF